ncbi:MAG: hypothetical protein HQ500_09480 [Flavobacteriales bacterium]|nr:hypothetical protein [Flavobacteriales bacterium]
MPNFPLRFVFLLGVSLSAINLNAQNAIAPPIDAAQSFEQQVIVGVDSSTIAMEPRMKRYLEMMDSLDAATMKSHGYRIQIFSGAGPNARKMALEKQSDFLKLFNQERAYTKWNYPNWVVRLGDFRTHLEALEFHHEIRQIYPASFIVKDEITVE